jgi:hypothetical protein
VDDQLRPYDDQWAFLSLIKRLAPDEAQALLRKVYPASDVINVRHGATDYDETSDPWILPPSGRLADKAITEPLPPNVSIKLGNLIYIEKKDLPDVFLDRLILARPTMDIFLFVDASGSGKLETAACHNVGDFQEKMKGINWRWLETKLFIEPLRGIILCVNNHCP